MAEKYTITKEQLIEFGMKDPGKPDNILYPLIKTLGSEKDECGDESSLDLVITLENNSTELALVAPGCTLYLGGVQSIEDLKVIERCITSFEPDI